MTEKKYNNENKGRLFRNRDKTDDRHADYRGNLNVAGEEFWLNAWVRTSKAGEKYMGLSLKRKEPAKAKPEIDDEVPF